jgi:hypothetical protein
MTMEKLIAIYTEQTKQSGNRAWDKEQEHGPELIDEDIFWVEPTEESAVRHEKLANYFGGSTGIYHRHVAATIRKSI